MNGVFHYMFPTFVASFQSDNHEAYKKAFYAQMPQHRIPHESGSGWVYGEESGKVYVHTDEALTELFRFISRCVDEYLAQLAFDRTRVDINIIKTWVNATDNNTITPVHLHGTSHLSFVYYMNIPKGADAIAFQIMASPNEPFLSAFGDSTHRQRSLILERNALNSNRFVLPVQEGQILVFPSHLMHGTTKVGDIGGEIRVSLAGDILLIYNETTPNYGSGVFDPKTWRKF
jgi:uncharacterized protein (TIGR02466 family)